MHELIYFDSPGYAEPIRFCLEISQVPWKNTTVDWDGYLALKNNDELPWGFLPILKTPQGTLAESNALVRYAAAVAGLEPEDLFVRGKVDELIELMNGWRADFTPTFYIDDLDEKIAARKALFAEDGKVHLGLLDLEKIYTSSATGWLAGTEDMTLADVKAFMNVFMMFSGQFDGIDATMLQSYPGLLEFHDFVANDERVKAYYDYEDELRWVYRPGAFATK
ncbi:MAG: glutathione S-transferase family protein [Euryarchaeota archaeon]